MNVTIQRKPSTDQGTFGILTVENNPFTCFTIELPWQGNEPQKSCIPAGTYQALWQYSPSKGMCYHLQNVPGRSLILIHSGNWAGDVDQGWFTNFLGCIGLGRSIGNMMAPNGKMQDAIMNSKAAINDFTLLTKGDPITLTIIDPPED